MHCTPVKREEGEGVKSRREIEDDKLLVPTPSSPLLIPFHTLSKVAIVSVLGWLPQKRPFVKLFHP